MNAPQSGTSFSSQMAETPQTRMWQGEFGRAYTERNPLHVEQLVSRSEINRRFLDGIPKEASILEVGCNVGTQLLLLRKQGYTDLSGIEIQSHALSVASSRLPGVALKQASALSLPFGDQSFDLVFTSGVLIHIAPENIPQVMKEIHRCARRYVWGTEYFSPEPISVSYRGHEDLLWKMDYARLYLSLFPDLEVVQEQRLRYIENENVDSVFLLRKR